MCNVTPFTIEKINVLSGLVPGTGRSVGQHLTYIAFGAPFFDKHTDLTYCMVRQILYSTNQNWSIGQFWLALYIVN